MYYTLQVILASLLGSSPITANLPVVDLGYCLQRASSFNETRQYYRFENIRYAAPPTQELRWRAPQHPAINRTVIQDGAVPRVCPQVVPKWLSTVYDWIPGYIVNGTIPYPDTNHTQDDTYPIEQDPNETEDCLFLDVYTPKDAFESKTATQPLAPVLVWIHGGGYFTGSKTLFGNAMPLISRKHSRHTSNVVYVAINYRLGIYGFLAGSSMARSGLLNAGLHDQRFALQWIQDNIHLFGGDKNRVTVFGESGGGGSIMYHLTAYGGAEAPLFQRAIVQSPAWFPYKSVEQSEQVFTEVLASLNVGTLDEARGVNASALRAANTALFAASPYGTAPIGPVIDNTLVPADPKILLRTDRFHAAVEVMSSFTSDEGLLFSPPLHTDAAYIVALRALFPSAPKSVIAHIAQVLYPPIMNGSYGYTDHVARMALTASEAVFTCNVRALNRAYGPQSYSYAFAEWPGLHGGDIGYTFYDPAQPNRRTSIISQKINATVAYIIQDWIVSFAVEGKPTTETREVSKFPQYGQAGHIIWINSNGTEVKEMSTAEEERCRWWERGLWYT